MLKIPLKKGYLKPHYSSIHAHSSTCNTYNVPSYSGDEAMNQDTILFCTYSLYTSPAFIQEITKSKPTFACNQNYHLPAIKTLSRQT